MKNSLPKLSLAVPTILAATCVSCPAYAQSSAAPTAAPSPDSATAAADSGSGLGEIVVTARRTAENQQTVPVSVTSYSTVQLQQRNIVNITDIANTTSNVSSVQAIGTKYGAAVNIRGQIQRANTIVTDQSVGIYFDDVYFARPYTILSDLVDVADVQVLKGPQGTLYGRNTTGGAVKVTSNPADPSGLSGLVRGSYGNYDAVVLTGVINLPIVTDKLAIRYAGSYRNHNGYSHYLIVPTVSAAGGGRATSLTPTRNYDVDDENSQSHRLSVRAKPTEDLTIDLVGSYFRANDHGVFFVTPYGDIENYTIGNGTPSVYSRSPQNQASFRTALSDVVPYSKLETRSLIGTVAWDVSDALSAKLIVGYVKQHARSRANSDGTVSTTLSYLDIQSVVGQRQHQLSEEFQLSGHAFDEKLKYIAGLYNFEERGSEDNLGAQTYIFNANRTAANFFDGHNKSSSAYVDVIYALTDSLRINGGLRYTRDVKATDNHARDASAGFPGVCIFDPVLTPAAVTSTTNGGPCSFFAKKAFHFATYEVGADYRITPDVFIYAKINDGQRSGGQQGRLARGQLPIPFDPETVTNYEAGIKSELFDRHLRLNAAYFHDNYKDIQLAVQLLIPGGSVTTSTQNFGSAHIDGVELESVLALGRLTLTGTGGYVKSHYLNPLVQQIYSPKWTASLAAHYVQPLSFGELNLAADYSYVGRRKADNFTATPAAELAGYKLLNARAAINFHNGLELAVFGKNLANKNYYTNIIITGYSATGAAPFFGVRGATIGAPRTYGVEATFRF